MPPRKSALKKSNKKANVIGPELNPTPSEQEILDAVPHQLGRLTKRVAAVSNTYLIYVVLHTNFKRPPTVVIRKSYESQFEAFEAFTREYKIWTTGTSKSGIFPSCHASEHFATAQLINQLEQSRAEIEGPFKTSMPLRVEIGGRVEYSLVHRDDADLDDNDPRKRKCTVVCEQTTYEAAV